MLRLARLFMLKKAEYVLHVPKARKGHVPISLKYYRINSTCE